MFQYQKLSKFFSRVSQKVSGEKVKTGKGSQGLKKVAVPVSLSFHFIIFLFEQLVLTIQNCAVL